jgi:hypothetical protein
MQTTLTEWCNRVTELRDSYPSLNYFTTDQLVLLSTEFAKVHYLKEPLGLEASMLLNQICRGECPFQWETAEVFRCLATEVPSHFKEK